jgi:hypothetical protein
VRTSENSAKPVNSPGNSTRRVSPALVEFVYFIIMNRFLIYIVVYLIN